MRKQIRRTRLVATPAAPAVTGTASAAWAGPTNRSVAPVGDISTAMCLGGGRVADYWYEAA